MKRLFALLFFFLFFVLASKAHAIIVKTDFKADINTQVSTTSNTTITGEHIESFDSDIVIRKDGTIHVKETVFYDFSNLSRHGIYRTIFYTKAESNGKTYELSFSNFSVTNRNGKSYQFQKTTSDSIITLKIGDPDRTITGSHFYVISYDVSGALGYFQNHDELYWNVTGDEWNVPIKSAYATVTLPANIKDNLTSACYTGGYGSKESNCSIDQRENVLTFKSDSFLNTNSGLTVVVGFPKGIIATLLPQERIPFFDTLVGKITLVLIVAGLFLWYLVLPILLVILWFKYGRDPYVGKPVTAWYDPPQTKNRRILTPAETGGLVDETVDNRDIFATIIDLARRGYMRIEEREKKDFYLVFTSKSRLQDKIQPFEEELLTGIFAGERDVRVKDTKMYATINKVSDMLHKEMVKNGYFKTNPKTIRTWYYVLGGFAVFTFNFVLAFVAFLFGKNMPRKTLFGAEQANVGKGLKNFLSSQKRQLKFQGDKQMLFEKLLPYAVAFGVEKIWAQRFAAFDLKPPTWYRGYSGSTFNSVIFANSLHSSYSSFASVSHAPSGTGSGFGGGGFSGGGGGGGGGGSW